MKKTKNGERKICNFKRVVILVAIILFLLMSCNINNYLSVFATDGNPTLQINGISGKDGNFLLIKNGETTIGKVGIRFDGTNDYLAISNDNNNYKKRFTTEDVGRNVRVDVIPEEGYEVGGVARLFSEENLTSEELHFDGADEENGSRSIGIDIIDGLLTMDDIDIHAIGSQGSGEQDQLSNSFVQLNGNYSVSGSYFNFKNPQDTIIGKVGVKLSNSNDYLPIDGNAVRLPKSAINDAVKVYFIPEAGYEVGNTTKCGGADIQLSGADEHGVRCYTIDVTDNLSIILDNVSFVSSNQQGGNGGEGEHHDGPIEEIPNYEVAAEFDGVANRVNSNEEGKIVLPDGWTKGNIKFYARTCKINGQLAPYHEGIDYDEGTYEEVRMDIEGLINGTQINNTAESIGERGDRKGVIKEGFSNYGKASFHLMNERINTIVCVVTKDFISVRANSPLGMTYSLGSATIDNVILTNTQSGAVSIFFGNTETKLEAEGLNVAGISKVVGGTSVRYENGAAFVSLPPLSKETTTNVVITIDLKDGTKVTKTLNIIRTAITLAFNKADGDATLQAGYVFNKAYLYENKNHNDKIFNAYLQVILYKKGVVAGYRQVKIDDEQSINALHENESGSMELLSDKRINLYGKQLNDTIEGVDSASVFLTNGPIDFNSDTLPSIEFGIGSGVTVEWGNN